MSLIGGTRQYRRERVQKKEVSKETWNNKESGRMEMRTDVENILQWSHSSSGMDPSP